MLRVMMGFVAICPLPLYNAALVRLGHYTYCSKQFVDIDILKQTNSLINVLSLELSKSKQIAISCNKNSLTLPDVGPNDWTDS